MRLFILLVALLLATLASAQTKIHDVIYMKSGGTAFTMDVLKPAKPNKAAVIFIWATPRWLHQAVFARVMNA